MKIKQQTDWYENESERIDVSIGILYWTSGQFHIYVI